LDVGAIGLTGKDAEKRLEGLGILSNRNVLPFDPKPPFEASGLRLGTPTITARGYDAADVREIGEVIASALRGPRWDETVSARLRGRVRDLVKRPRPSDTLADLCWQPVQSMVT
jgi:glycine hydroxymethyltransferase